MGIVDKKLDVLIIGAGPAGLAAAAACSKWGLDFYLVERGAEIYERDRNHPEQITMGVGGAGLFSDGKFSFFPSATHLWHLQPTSLLRQSYDWFSELISSYGILAHPFPDPSLYYKLPFNEQQNNDLSFQRKIYPSYFMSLESRYALIKNLISSHVSRLLTRREVCSIQPDKCGMHVKIIETHSKYASKNISSDILARALIISTGRLGPLLLASQLKPNLFVFRRLELGIRIEQSADEFFLRDETSLDPKLILTDTINFVEWRTFCCCRQGEVIQIVSDGIKSVAGRSDIEKTGNSNIAFLLRITDERTARTLWKQLLLRLNRSETTFSEALQAIISDKESSRSLALTDTFGTKLEHLLLKGIHYLIEHFGIDNLKNALAYGPAIEGVSYYPFIGKDLKLNGLPIWIAGDATGIFRGLTAALVSGYFAALIVAKELGAIK